MYRGVNQVDDIINAGFTTIFFVDDNQMIRPDDIGSTSEIKRVARIYDAQVTELELTAQFRCSGADGYINWLDDVFHIKKTGNFDGWDKKDFDFKIFDNPNDLYSDIKAKHDNGLSARMLAGYAWNWTKNGNGDADVEDVEILEHNFKMPWNSRKVGTTWAIDACGIDQIGCIHTSQGLEFDYIGVIIGNELRFDPRNMEYYVDYDSYKDSVGKKGLKFEPIKLASLVKNIYKTLMSRGMKGCYIYVCDKDVREYLRSRLG